MIDWGRLFWIELINPFCFLFILLSTCLLPHLVTLKSENTRYPSSTTYSNSKINWRALNKCTFILYMYILSLLVTCFQLEDCGYYIGLEYQHVKLKRLIFFSFYFFKKEEVSSPFVELQKNKIHPNSFDETRT